MYVVDARATHTPFSRPYQAHPRPWFHLQGLESLSSVSDNLPQLERRQNILSASWSRFNGKGVQSLLYSIRSLGPCVWHHESEAGFCGIRAALRVSIPFPPPDAFLAPQVCQCIVRLILSHPLKASLHHSSQTATGRCSRGRQNQDFVAAPAVLALLCQARQLEFAAPTPPPSCGWSQWPLSRYGFFPLATCNIRRSLRRSARRSATSLLLDSRRHRIPNLFFLRHGKLGSP
ncbi:hypothetical protein BKA56DRAFT_303200 [Ilyonectria sp. MPI-CAGE-AT-0026]|nr:hypothetical protein BKA56DRAFT_303200 [Ilyonectria sp. MPI-CAGE-AT-0026]